MLRKFAALILRAMADKLDRPTPATMTLTPQGGVSNLPLNIDVVEHVASTRGVDPDALRDAVANHMRRYRAAGGTR